MKFKVEGMRCGHCVRAITGALQALDVNAGVTVDLDHGMVSVTGDLTAEQISATIQNEGYTATIITPV